MSDHDPTPARIFRDYATALYASLADDPFYRALEDSVADRSRSKQAMLAYYDYSILEAAQYGHVVQPEPDRFGISVWAVPLASATAAHKAAAKKTALGAVMGEASLQLYTDISASMSRTTGPLVSDRDWYLSILGVLPEYQGKGLGKDLIRPILDKADSAGAATYLETFTPRNMSFYRRLGYQAAGSFD